MTTARVRSLAVVSVAALVTTLLVACTHRAPAASKPDAGADAVVTAGTSTTVSTDGISVTLPDGATKAGSTLRLTTTAPEADGLTAPFVPVGQAAVATLDGGTLSKPAQVTFPVPETIDGVDVVPFVVWQDGRGGWRLLPTTYTPGARTIVASTDHFSFGFLSSIDVKKWAADRKTAFVNYISGRSGVAQPSCGDEKGARANGIAVTSDGGDSVKWCFGVQNGQTVMKVANNRRTYTEIDYPSTWKLQGSTSVTFTPETVSRVIGTVGAYPGRGRTARIVDGGDTATFVVPKGQGGKVTASISSLSFLIDAIFFGVETYAAVANASPASAEADGSLQRIADKFAGRGDDGYTAAFKTCTSSFTHLTGSIDDIAPGILQVAWECIPALMKADLEEAGADFFGAGTVLSAIGAVVALVLTAVHLLVVGLRELWDGLVSLGGNDDPTYDITVSVPAPVATVNGYGPVTVGMTLAQVKAVTGGSPKKQGSCVLVGYDVPGGGRAAVDFDAYTGKFVYIDTPNGTKTDRGVGDGSTVAQVKAAYPGIQEVTTQAGLSLVFGPRSGGPGSIGFAVDQDGTVGPPLIAGVPGFEYCSG